MKSLVLLMLVGVALAQEDYSKGHIKILQDQRFHDGKVFGNRRVQEDGIQYFEQTNEHGIRTGYWEYPEPNGQINRVEFESGPGIGFRITNSNLLAPTPVANPQPQFQPAPAPVPAPAPTHAPVHVQPHHPVHVPVNHAHQYPGNLEFSRHSQGHRFKFTAA